jgi:RNA recognition motif-containing protein
MTYKLFVGGLSIQMKEKDIKSYFSSFGQIRSVKVIRNQKRVSKCYAFMWMEDESTMKTILESKSHKINGRVVDVNFVIDAKKEAVRRMNELKLKKLFVGGLSKCTSSEELKQYFESFGEVRSCFVICRPDSKVSRRFGYVEFTDPQVAQSVLENQGLYLKGNNISCRRFGEKDSDCAVGSIPTDESSLFSKNINSDESSCEENVQLSASKKFHGAAPISHVQLASKNIRKGQRIITIKQYDCDANNYRFNHSH